jgi:hypothetical protein
VNRPLDPDLAEGSNPLRGIVEEQVRKEKELLNPIRFFGGPILFPLRMLQVLKDVNTFIDMKSMTTYMVREYILCDER